MFDFSLQSVNDGAGCFVSDVVLLCTVYYCAPQNVRSRWRGVLSATIH